LKKRAEDLHLNCKLLPISDGRNGRFVAREGSAFSRWFCDVEYRDGKVVNKRVHRLD